MGSEGGNGRTGKGNNEGRQKIEGGWKQDGEGKRKVQFLSEEVWFSMYLCRVLGKRQEQGQADVS